MRPSPQTHSIPPPPPPINITTTTTTTTTAIAGKVLLVVNGGPSLQLATALRSSPPDYVECDNVSNASTCRAFDANGFDLPGAVQPFVPLDNPTEDAVADISAARERETSPRRTNSGDVDDIDGRGAGRDSNVGADVDDVTVSLVANGGARVEVTLIERSTDMLGPFPVGP
jgi:hypothetical protein